METCVNATCHKSNQADLMMLAVVWYAGSRPRSERLVMLQYSNCLQPYPCGRERGRGRATTPLMHED